MSSQKKYILDQVVAEKKMRRMALGIIENNADEKELILAGIRENGCVVAKVIQQMLSEISPIHVEIVSISLDKREPSHVEINSKVDFNNKVIIIIDDVADSGKTLLYALKPFLDYQPRKIQTLVLVERSHNSFPVHRDYAGLSIATTLQEHIQVEVDGEKVLGAYLE